MPRFSERSLKYLETCEARLQLIANKAIEDGPDFSVICGHRPEQAQRLAFNAGKSKVEWPNSKHNAWPAKAMDLTPYPLDWNDRARFLQLGSYILGIAAALGIPLRWGGDWDHDWDWKDESFYDGPHFELID